MVTKSAQETQELGQRTGSDLKEGQVLALEGELGSGKTTFVQGLAQGLGIKERILSPTFIMIREYPVKKPDTLIKHFYHVDLYRLEKAEEIEVLGLKEIWSDPENLVVIEWAEKIKNLLPEKRMEILFEYLGEEKRKVIIKEK